MFSQESIVEKIRQQLDSQEQEILSGLACCNRESLRRREEKRPGYRQNFAMDADRILHSKSYSRYIDKTQVFSLIENDHISHRVLHVQLVARISRTIGRFLALNEDLIESIALGHDIGHPPFGHEGERILSKICRLHGLPSFQHNVQSIQFLDRFERKGTGWNLSLQVLDGILCHDGEVNVTRLRPDREKNFALFDCELKDKADNPSLQLYPMTLEGCVVRLADTIAYIGRDIEDAIELGFISRKDIPTSCASVLGTTNGTIVHTLVTDLICNSTHVRTARTQAGERDFIGFSEAVATQLLELKRFNYQNIYTNAAFKPDFVKIHRCYEQLFDYFLRQAMNEEETGETGRFLRSMSKQYRQEHNCVELVRDYLAGMTDKFFLRKAREIGCDVPERLCVQN
ncbi:deoxyguanosinetriphosphate triphosphohydrolase family protein [Desulfogranum japonicum]|uniref:deoxyguanosinetriphosphate triphosphohydrolase family protein n=1 Tax=Desulfogranum japonicum TaxID=231447 RepID=UPI000408BC1C|nr:HD domain-containing protein [Desulfogranum japonicum]